MEPFRIAHISDLHFGMPHQRVVWDSLVDYLLTDLKPDAVIATGDLADTPDPALFNEVAKEFNRLTQADIRWAVCAGNHDRHGQGNAGLTGKVIAFFKGSKVEATSFDGQFEGRIANLARPVDWTFTRDAATPKWRLRIIGIDSSEDAKYTAQGFIKLDVMGSIRAPTRGKGEDSTFDLVVALVHHHLLPIAALDSSHQSAKSLLSTTILVNAGSVLENFASNNVNLVLHGHEHKRNIARFGVPGETLASDLVVIGAGSATGADTWLGCDVTRASFNLLELRRDRSVYVREGTNSGGRWRLSDQAVRVLDGRQIREGRVLRRFALEARPVSRIDRHFVFGEYRDIEVRETRTFCPIVDGRLTFDVQRPSGAPVLGQLKVEWEGGGTSRWAGDSDEQKEKANFEHRRDGDKGYRLQVGDLNGHTMAQRLELEYRWARSAVLTMTDIKRLRGEQLDYFRSKDLEAVSIHVSEPLDSLTLGISLPPALPPEPGSILVYVGSPEGGKESIAPHKELQEFLHVMPGGHASVTVPFPLPGFRYFLAWKPHAAFLPDKTVVATRDRIGASGNSLMEKIVADLTPLLRRRCSAALYVPEMIGPGGVQFRLRGFASREGNQTSTAAGRPADLYRARNEFDGILGAWYGEASWASVDPENPDDQDAVWPGEETVFVLPAYQFRWSPAAEPWGIIRIGLGSGEPIGEELAERIAMAAAIVV